jgi:hypothetical protein
VILVQEAKPRRELRDSERVRLQPPRLVSQRKGRLERLLDWLEAQALFVVGIAAVGAVSLGLAPKHLNQDGWLALVGGRLIANHGLPHHDTLSVMAHGVTWIDQQWLAQLAIYGLYQAGGLALYVLVYVALTMAGLGIAIAAARRLGGNERHVLWVLPLTAFLYFAGSFQIRTQGFAYPLFALTLWLLGSEARGTGTKRGYLVLPLLIVWGNLHGSVTIGAGLAVLYGVTLLVADLNALGRRTQPRLIRGRTVLFLVAPVLCLFATPYGPSIITYYRETLLNPAFGHLVTEWQPVTSVLVLAVPFFVVAFATLWLLGRAGAQARLFDHLTLIFLAVGGVLAVRNITWFGLAVLILLPGTLGVLLRPRRTPDRRRAVNLTLAGLSLALALAAVVAVSAQPVSWFEKRYDARAPVLAARLIQSRPSALIYASDRFGDWLLWKEPSLAGHIAYDIRFELLSDRQLNDIADLGQTGQPRGGGGFLSRYAAFVVDAGDRAALDAVVQRPGIHVLLRGRGVVVAVAARS